MKTQTVIAVLALTLAATFAQATTIASLTGVNQKISKIDLDDQGLLKVTLNPDQEMLTKKLSVETKNMLNEQVSELSAAELLVIHRDVVCMMMPMNNFSQTLKVATSFDDQSEVSDATLKTVLSAQGCMYSNMIKPKSDYNMQLALSLKNTLIALGQEASARH